MNINDYQKAASLTAQYGVRNKIVYPVLGLNGEAGEVAEKVKKVLRDQEGVFTDENKAAIVKELGDVMWYIAALTTDLDVTLEEVCQINLDKLKSRQKRGKISGSGDDR